MQTEEGKAGRDLEEQEVATSTEAAVGQLWASLSPCWLRSQPPASWVWEVMSMTAWARALFKTLNFTSNCYEGQRTLNLPP